MGECTFSVMVRKTVQVKQYEPTVIELKMEGTCERGDIREEYQRAFSEIKSEMNSIFGTGGKIETFLD